jgi:hypothetical protein
MSKELFRVSVRRLIDTLEGEARTLLKENPRHP